MNVREFFLKLILMMVALLSMLAFADIIALIFSIRPQSVIVYTAIGIFSSYVGYKVYDKVINKKEDPVPEYILKTTRETYKEVEILKEIMEEYGISKEEVKMRAKLREENGRERHRKGNDSETEESPEETSNENDQP